MCFLKQYGALVDARVAIIGAGPAGLSLALGLAHHGVRSVVLERATEPVPESRAIVIWPRTAEVLRDWNAWEPLRAAGRFSHEFAAHNARTNRRLIAIDFTRVDDIVDDAGVLFLPQNETERILRDLVANNPACELRAGTEVMAIAQDDGGVTIGFEHEDTGGELRAAYAVGCDGAHGLTRKALGLELEGMTYDARVLLSDVEIPGTQSLCSPRVVLNRPGMLGAFLYGGCRWRVMATIPKDASEVEAYDEGAHAERLRLLFGEAGTHATTVWRNLFRIHRRHARRFAQGRIALAGDAAHLNSPAGGQGMNAAIQDAANIAWKLAYALSGANGPALIDSYDVERREMIADTVERFTDRATRVGVGMPSSARRLALMAFGKAVKGRGMQRKLCRAFGMLSGRYTMSALIDARHPLAGRRIDDLILPDGSRINHARKGRAALVAVGKVGTQKLKEFDAIAVPRAPKRWCVKPPAILIVRPDGVVAAVVEKPNPTKVRDAWKRAFAGVEFPQ